MKSWKLVGSGIVVTPKTAPREAGRLGGHARSEALGKEGMREIAKRGGAATAAKGKAHLSELGKRGQRARAANLRCAVLKEVESHILSSRTAPISAERLSAETRILEWLWREMAKALPKKSGIGPGG